ncbi:MAG: hypothetical protein M1832_001282 [Thelocarpon impressellum]|nr:MAG: hypothetical protein M1832_001282 [Thelocarpon impressellum]
MLTPNPVVGEKGGFFDTLSKSTPRGATVPNGREDDDELGPEGVEGSKLVARCWLPVGTVSPTGLVRAEGFEGGCLWSGELDKSIASSGFTEPASVKPVDPILSDNLSAFGAIGGPLLGSARGPLGAAAICVCAFGPVVGEERVVGEVGALQTFEEGPVTEVALCEKEPKAGTCGA